MKKITIKNIKTNKNTNKGFTLIETLVSLTLFTIVLVMAGGTVVSVIDINKRNQAISSVVNNLNYSIDSMIRDIKTGYLYKCDHTLSYRIDDIKTLTAEKTKECIDLTLVSTISGNHVVVKYKFIKPELVEGQNGYIEKTTYSSNGDVLGTYNITDTTNVNIEDVKLSVKNPDPLECVTDVSKICDHGQPSVGIVIKGKAGSQSIEVSKFYVQTFISQRLINITDFID